MIIKEKIIGDFYRNSATLRLEIDTWSISQNNVEVVFKNGSKILAVTASDTSRGYRGNVLILDEFRLIKTEIRDEVLIPMLSVPRQPKYINNPEFKEYTQEENIQIYISSAYYSSEWIYDYSKKTLKDFLNGKSGTYFLAMDYKLALHERLTTQKYIDLQKSKMDEVSFAMEFDTIFYGQNKNALFSYDSLKRLRVLKTSFKPLENHEYVTMRNKHRQKIISERDDGEIRIVAVDVALLGGNKNDASQFICMNFVPHGNRYIRKVDYIESMEGVHSSIQAIRLKQLYEDYCADFVVMDCNGTSLPLYEAVSQRQQDDERGVKYEAWSAINSENLKVRAVSDTPLNIVYSIVATPFGNHEMNQILRQSIADGLLKLLVEENEAFEEFIKNDIIEEFADSDMKTSEYAEKKVKLLESYIQTTATINELINLDYTVENGYIKVKTKGRKDRYSALLYGNYFAKLKEDENLKQDDSEYSEEHYAVRTLIL